MAGPGGTHLFQVSCVAYGLRMSLFRFEYLSGNWRWVHSLLAFCIVGSLLLCPDFAFAQQGPVRSLQEIRHEGVVIQQWDTSCGAAALATVLTYSRHDPVSERQVAAGMLRMTEPLKVKVRGGFSLLDMKHFVETRGYKGEGYQRLTLGGLLKLNSPIVPIVQYGNPHFIVVRGLDTDGRVNIADPGFGNRTMSVEDFDAVWKDHIGFIVFR
jgi:predicted double-glycine peptidase